MEWPAVVEAGRVRDLEVSQTYCPIPDCIWAIKAITNLGRPAQLLSLQVITNKTHNRAAVRSADLRLRSSAVAGPGARWKLWFRVSN